jgi:hypothetical protein
MLMIAAGYQDADALRRDPMFKLALDRLPSDEELSSQSTISRLESLPDTWPHRSAPLPARILSGRQELPRCREGSRFSTV